MASSPSYIPYLCVAAAAFITTFLAVPLVKRLAIKLDAVDYPSKRRINTKPIPRLGGTADVVARAAKAAKFKGKASSAMDMLAPAELPVARLIIAGAAANKKAPAGTPATPDGASIT